jgi:hypothetical protein
MNRTLGTVVVLISLPVAVGVGCFTSQESVGPVVATGCTSDAECGAAAPCVTYTCSAQACKATYAPAKTLITDDTKGDCKRPECDGKGGVVEVPDPADVPVSRAACVTEACSSEGVPIHGLATTGTTCTGKAGAHVCDVTGSCVECNQPHDCTASGAYCYKGGCATCADGEQNGDETGVDCGGSHCLECNGGPCTTYSDCKSNSCSGGTCFPCQSDAQCGTGHCTTGTCSP